MKILLLLALLGLNISVVFSSDLTVNYTSSHELILTSKNCSELIQEHQSICRWKKNLDSTFTYSSNNESSCKKNANGLFSIRVSDCLPDLVKKIQNKKNYKDGANCWGTALSLKQLSKKPRFVWSNEMKYWLDSPLCRKLEPFEKKQPGDLLNMFGPEYIFSKDNLNDKDHLFWEALYPGRITPFNLDFGYSGYHHLLHTETFVSDKLAFGKVSPSKLDKFEFHQMNEVYARQRESECQENQTMSPHYRENQALPKNIKGSKCDYFSLAYRCENIVDYFLKQKLSQDENELLKSIIKLNPTLASVSNLMFTSEVQLNKTEIKSLVKLSDKLALESLKKLKEKTNNKNLEMLLVYKYFQASSIRKSLEQARLIPATEEL